MQVRVYWHFREELNSWCGEQRGGHVTHKKTAFSAVYFLRHVVGFIQKIKACVRE